MEPEVNLIRAAMARSQPIPGAPKGLIPPAVAKAAAVTQPVFVTPTGFSSAWVGKRVSGLSDMLQNKRPKPSEAEPNIPEKQSKQVVIKREPEDGDQNMLRQSDCQQGSINHNRPIAETALQAIHHGEMINSTIDEETQTMDQQSEHENILNHDFPMWPNSQLALLARMMKTEAFSVQSQGVIPDLPHQDHGIPQATQRSELPMNQARNVLQVSDNASFRCTEKFPDGAKIEFNLVNGIREGEALLTLPYGDTLKFAYRNGLPEGEAFEQSLFGWQLEFTFMNGKREGQALERNNNLGAQFRGKQEGASLKTLPDGGTLKFAYRNGKREGEALQTRPDGSTLKFAYRNGFPEGEARRTFSNGNTLQFTYRKGQRVGNALMETPDGGTIEFIYKNGYIYGPVLQKFSDGSSLTLIYINDSPQARGAIMKYRDGSTLERTFRRGKPDGPAVLQTPDGNKIEFSYTRGQADEGAIMNSTSHDTQRLQTPRFALDLSSVLGRKRESLISLMVSTW